MRLFAEAIGPRSPRFWVVLALLAFLALVPVCALFFVIQRYLVQGLTAGAVKG